MIAAPTTPEAVAQALDALPGPVRDEIGARLIAGELATESLADAQLALEDRGWTRIGATLDRFDRAGIERAATTCRAMVVTNPLIRRGMNLRISYVWGGGVQCAAADPDINTVLQAFLDDVGNKAALTGEQAREENERTLGTDGNLFVALQTTDRRTGWVQARTIPLEQVTEVIANPEDADDPWLYRRTWTVTTLSAAVGGAARGVETRHEFYPALTYRPVSRPRSIDGHPVRWDTPVLHVSVNRLNGWDLGLGDVYTALPWARAYTEFLRDWALLMKSLAKLAWRTTTKGSKADAAATRMRAALIADTPAGQAAVTSPDVTLEAVPKTGATLDADSGRPLATLVATGLDLPVTMLLGDPGVTGARATAETLDRPMALAMKARQARNGEALRAILGHVVKEAVRAPQGPLRAAGVVRPDPLSGRDRVEWRDDRDGTITVDWPDLNEPDVKTLVDAVVAADGTERVPPLVTLRLLLKALGVDDIDEILDGVTDDDGAWVGTGEDQALVAAGRAAMDAGRVPTPARDPDPVDDQE